MSGTTSVPPIQFTSTGLVLPTDAAILAGVQADMNAAFGGNLNPSLSTPQGQLATSIAAITSAKNSDVARFVSSIDPATASGFMQDAIGKIYFMTRKPAVSTTVQVTCYGLTGVIIPVGAQVRDSSGNIYAATQAGTIPAGGNVILPFAALIAGPTPCPVGAISGAPYRAIVGFDSATNATAGVVGAYVESRADFEYRRQQSVAVNAKGSLPSIYASVFGVANVTDVYVVDNVSDSAVQAGVTNYSLAPHSIYVAVVGGVDADVANAIWKKKDVGANYNGNTTIVVTDNSGYSNPLPTYNVQFQRPTSVPINFVVNVQNLTGTPNSTVQAQIQAAIVSAFVGGDGGQRARIASFIYASRFFAPIATVGPLNILSVYIGKNATANQSSVSMGIDESPVTATANITVNFS